MCYFIFTLLIVMLSLILFYFLNRILKVENVFLFEDEINYIITVLYSCHTKEQLDNSLQWGLNFFEKYLPIDFSILFFNILFNLYGLKLKQIEKLK